MVAEPTLEPTVVQKEEEEEFDEEEESDVYEVEGDEEGDSYEPEEDEDEEGEEGFFPKSTEDHTALLLGKPNGTLAEEEEDEDEDEDEEYQEGPEHPPKSATAGSKRSVEELSEGDADGDEDEDEDEGHTTTKKARV